MMARLVLEYLDDFDVELDGGSPKHDSHLLEFGFEK